MPKTILVVDDERHIVRLMQVNLERSGYAVVTAFNGRDALEKVEVEHPDLIVLDAMMPYMDGFEVLQTLRSNQSTRDIPVIMLLLRANDVDVFKGWQTDRDGYLLKPFHPLQLLSLTKRHLIGLGEQTSSEQTSARNDWVCCWVLVIVLTLIAYLLRLYAI